MQPIDVERDLLAGVYTDEKGGKLPYRYFVPLGMEKDRKVPLLLFLHGAGERGDDNRAQLKHVVRSLFADPASPVYSGLVLIPQCAEGDTWVNNGLLKGAYRSGPESEPLKKPSLNRAMAVLGDFMSRYPVDPARVYVMGISMGGHGTWHLLGHNPELFAAGVPICGSGDMTVAPVVAKKPVHAFHSSDDPAVPVSGSRDMVQAVLDAGGKTMRYTEYNYAGHGCWEIAVNSWGLLDWLYAQRLGG